MIQKLISYSESLSKNSNKYLIYYRTLGTANEEVWPGINEFPEYKPDIFPKWRGVTLKTKMNNLLDEDGIELLSV